MTGFLLAVVAVFRWLVGPIRFRRPRFRPAAAWRYQRDACPVCHRAAPDPGRDWVVW